MTLVQLATATEFNARSLSGHENGRQRPNQDILRHLAAALDMLVDLLCASDVDAIPVDAINFRALNKITIEQRDTAAAPGASP